MTVTIENAAKPALIEGEEGDENLRGVREGILVCVSGSPYSERLIRAAHRLAGELQAPWYTVYIETPGSGKHLSENRERVWRDLRLAESLGARVATETATSVAEAAIDFAIKRNVTRIVVGKPAKPRWREFLHPPIVDQIIRLSGTIDVYVVSIESASTRPKPAISRQKTPFQWTGYMASAALVSGATLAGQLVRPFLDPTNLVMIYLLAVVLAAIRLGLRPAIMTAFLSVAAFDFFFVPPRLTLVVADTEYLITFAALFTVGVVISKLVATAGERAETIRDREVQTSCLYHLSRDLAAAVDMKAILDAIDRNIGESLDARVAVLFPEGEGLSIAVASQGLRLDIKELAVADWAYRNRQAAGMGTEARRSSFLLYLPLQTPTTILGVLGVKLTDDVDYSTPQKRRLLDAFANQSALAMERVQLVKQAEQAQILRARESLERALLNSVSHDLRTPLVSITGALGSLREEGGKLSDTARRELLDAAWEEAGRLNRFVGNLLDMTRLEAGAVKLKKEPCDIQDLVGCALAAIEQRLGRRKVDVDLQAGLPLVRMDMALMTQVLVNLLDNALKYSPPESLIEIVAKKDDSLLGLEISDHGPGIPEADLKRVFDKFYRIPVPEGAGGTGLGLSICKGFVEAHGGKIRAENRAGGGLRVVITLQVDRLKAEKDK